MIGVNSFLRRRMSIFAGKNPEKMKAAIFDMDGTMVDNMMVHHRAWQKKLAEFGLDMTLEEIKEKVHGINEEILERLFADRFTPDERRQISREKEAAYREIFLPDLKLVAGLPEFLNQLSGAGIPMAVASAAPPENVNFVLDNLALRPYFPVVLHARDVARGKPHPEIYLKAADGLGLPPGDCVVFEDSPVGATAASRAGCPLVVVTTTHVEADFTGISNISRFIPDFRTITFADLQRICAG